jgi:hypothetical protein
MTEVSEVGTGQSCGKIRTPASSRTSAVRYSRTAVTYTAALAPTRILFWVLFLRKRLTRPQGN